MRWVKICLTLLNIDLNISAKFGWKRMKSATPSVDATMLNYHVHKCYTHEYLHNYSLAFPQQFIQFEGSLPWTDFVSYPIADSFFLVFYIRWKIIWLLLHAREPRMPRTVNHYTHCLLSHQRSYFAAGVVNLWITQSLLENGAVINLSPIIPF